MNKVFITGRLSRNPELKACNSGTEVCNFAVAVDRRVQKGEENKCDFIECTAWAKSGVFINTYFKKGDGIVVEGRLESSKWADKDGNNRTFWGVTVEKVEFPIGGKRSNNLDSEKTIESETPISEEDLPF